MNKVPNTAVQFEFCYFANIVITIFSYFSSIMSTSGFVYLQAKGTKIWERGKYENSENHKM